MSLLFPKTFCRLIFLCLTLLLGLTVQSEGAIYWVSTNGSDGNGCNNSPATNPLTTTAKQTIRAGIDCLSAGDTLFIRGGNYDPPGLFSAPAGSSGQPVLISGFQNERPVIVGLSGAGDDMIWVGRDGDPPAYLTITHIDINAINTRGGSCGVANQPNVTFDDITCLDSAANAFATRGNGVLNQPGSINSDGFILRNSHVFGCGRITGPAPTDTKGAGLYTGHSHGIVENNEIADCMGIGINIAYDSSNDSIYRNNIIHNLGCASKYGCSQSVSGTGPRAIGIGGSGVNGPNGPSNNLIYNNVIYSVRGSASGDTSGECIQFWGSGRAGVNQVYNNTCYDAGTHVAIHCDGDNPVVLENNLFVGIDDSNLVGGDPSCGTVSGTGTSGGVMSETLNMVNANPATTVVNAGAHDLHLKSGSPAINAGVNLFGTFTTDFDGHTRRSSGAWDMGAFEFGASGGGGILSQLAFSQQPATTAAGQTMATVQVQGQDSGGNLIASYANAVTVSLNTPALVPSSQMSLVSVDSTQASGCTGTNNSCAGTQAIDGDANSWWFTSGSDPMPHTLIVNLGNTYTVTGFTYLPFPLFDSGNILHYQFFVSTDGLAWGSPVADANFADDLTRKQVTFSGVTGHYVKLVALSEQHGNPWASVAELQVLFAGATLSGTLTQTASGGTASFSTLALDKGGLYTLHATDGTFSVNSAPFLITGSLPQLVFLQQPTGTVINRLLSPSVQVQAQDQSGAAIASFTNLITLTLNGSPTTLPSSQLTLVSVDSQETSCDGGQDLGTAAIDGNPATFWHTQFCNGTPSLPHTIIINTGAASPLTAVTYVPRTDGFTFGTIGQYELAVGTDGVHWGIVASGTFAANQTAKTVRFPSVVGPFLRLRALSEINGTQLTSVAELQPQVGGAWLSGTPSQAASNGTAAFPDLSADLPGTYTLTATASGASSATSQSFTLTIPPAVSTPARVVRMGH